MAFGVGPDVEHSRSIEQATFPSESGLSKWASLKLPLHLSGNFIRSQSMPAALPDFDPATLAQQFAVWGYNPNHPARVLRAFYAGWVVGRRRRGRACHKD